ncbi:MAG TPA: helix-turn-helix transcriptional regulator, partial [Mangrovimonas sp.]|nr:helix-turn-helix transcriptional regulator [Mangrovimonas sp.]
DTAYEYALKADSIAQAMDNTSLKLANLPNLAEASYAKKLYTESHEALKTYIHLYDSIKGVERVKEISALEEAYEAEKRENVIQLQQQENALLQEKNRASNNRNWAFGILALLIALVAYLLIHRFRLKNQQQRIQMKIRELENANLNKEINYKNRELTSKVLQIAQKNELLEELKSNLDTLKRTTGHSREVNQLYNKLQIEKQIDENWDSFLKQFTEINPKFYEELDQRHEGLTKNDFRLAALVKMNVNSKDIASILNISPEGVKKARYRLRKKLHLNSDDNLEQYLMML